MVAFKINLFRRIFRRLPVIGIFDLRLQTWYRAYFGYEDYKKSGWFEFWNNWGLSTWFLTLHILKRPLHCAMTMMRSLNSIVVMLAFSMALCCKGPDVEPQTTKKSTSHMPPHIFPRRSGSTRCNFFVHTHGKRTIPNLYLEVICAVYIWKGIIHGKL